MNAKQIRELLKEANRSGRNVYCHWNTETWRVMSANTRYGITWIRTIGYGKRTSDGLRQGFESNIMVTTTHTFDIR